MYNNNIDIINIIDVIDFKLIYKEIKNNDKIQKNVGHHLFRKSLADNKIKQFIIIDINYNIEDYNKFIKNIEKNEDSLLTIFLPKYYANITYKKNHKYIYYHMETSTLTTVRIGINYDIFIETIKKFLSINQNLNHY